MGKRQIQSTGFSGTNQRDAARAEIKKILNPFTGKEQETKPRAERIRLKAKASDKLVAELGVFVPVVDDDLEEDVKSELNTLISYRKIKSNDFSIFALEEAGLDLETLGLLVTNSKNIFELYGCLLYTSPSPRDRTRSRMPSSA